MTPEKKLALQRLAEQNRRDIRRLIADEHLTPTQADILWRSCLTGKPLPPWFDEDDSEEPA